jgi:hypothetical protein
VVALLLVRDCSGLGFRGRGRVSGLEFRVLRYLGSKGQVFLIISIEGVSRALWKISIPPHLDTSLPRIEGGSLIIDRGVFALGTPSIPPNLDTCVASLAAPASHLMSAARVVSYGYGALRARVKERRKKVVGKQVRAVLPKASVDTSLQVKCAYLYDRRCPMRSWIRRCRCLAAGQKYGCRH